MKRLNSNSGFSFVELLISIAILSIIMIAIGQFMGTSSKSYTRTNADISVQTTAQQVYNQISDNMMQANVIRIGVNGKEFACDDTNGAVKMDTTTGQLQKADGTAVDASSSGKSLYSFVKYTSSSYATQNVSYIYCEYESKTSSGYQTCYTTYVYDATEHNLYLNRSYGSLRTNSIETGNTGQAIVTTHTVTSPGTTDTAQIDTSKDSKNLYCKNVDYLYMSADAVDNLINVDLRLSNKSITYTCNNAVQLRNSYSLASKAYCDNPY